jgi:short-subunit dehydrogenase
VLEADDVARAVVKAIERGKQEMTVPWFPYRISSLAQAVIAAAVLSRLVTRRAGEHRDE